MESNTRIQSLGKIEEFCELNEDFSFSLEDHLVFIYIYGRIVSSFSLRIFGPETVGNLLTYIKGKFQ